MPPNTQLRAPRAHVVTEEDRVRVVIRVRPLPSGEQQLALPFDERNSSCDGAVYDRVLGPASKQSAAFHEVLPIAEMWLSGYNGTILAHGATCSGKTHTMLGKEGGKSDLDGVIPQIVDHALGRLSAERAQRAALSTAVAWNARLQASYVELYESAIRDLIRNDGDGRAPVTEENVDARPPAVREDANGVVFLQGVTKETIESPEQLMRLVRLGSKRRAMGRNYCHEHSSRSHAVLTLYLECRWKDTCTAEGRVKSSVSCLQLVDLAGAEFAAANLDAATFKQSIAINTGLFALGNVISALAGNRDRRVGNHIPYRDSLLTRLLQSALGGDARTALIVCVSPEPKSLGWTRMALGFASSARKITNAGKRHEETVEEEVEGPYTVKGDLADPDPQMDRRALYVETQFGDIFCRVLGPLSGELILFVHGSGPTNSSAFWNSLVWELACRVLDRKYCYVAIDCPGYGRSRGDRQHIRSNPGALLCDVIHGLGFKDALCIVGSSQGSCAAFNAVLQFPRICRRIAVIHPVGHDPSRYTVITQPTLLTFDDEDAGHPVSVGLIMKKNLPFNMFHRYKCSENPFWESEQTATEMIKLLDWNPQGAVPSGPIPRYHSSNNNNSTAAAAASAAAKSAGGSADAIVVREKLTGDLWRLAGGIVAWCESWGLGQECADLCYLRKPSEFLAKDVAAAGGQDDDLDMGMSASSSSTLYSDEKDSEWTAHIDDKTQRVFYVNESSKETKWIRPTRGKIANAPVERARGEEEGEEQQQKQQGAAAAAASGAIATFIAVNPVLQKESERIFKDANAGGNDDADDDADFVLDESQMARRAETEMLEQQCSCCSMPLWRPERGRDCRHAVCGWCFIARGAVSKRCPTCKRAPYDCVEGETKDMHQHMLSSVVRIAQYGANNVDAAIQLRKTLPRISLEFGNTASGAKGASFAVVASIRCIGVSKGAGKLCQTAIGNLSASSVISKVGFDINPSFPKSAVKVTQPPFTLSRDMATPFTCAMQISFGVPSLSWLTLVLPYAIHHVKDYRDWVNVYVVPAGMQVPLELMQMQPMDAEAPSPTPIAIIQQSVPRQAAASGRQQLPAGWFRLPDIDYDECAVTECFVILK